jgi:hypothetical protein
MSTSRRRRWVTLATVLALATTACDDNSPPDAIVGSPVAAAATERAVQALEADPGFAGEVTQAGGGWHPLCAARPIGISPDAARVEDVATVYTWVYCKWVPEAANTTPAPDPAGLPGLTSPIVVHLGDKLRYELPQDGEEHEQSVAEIFPANLRKVAIDGSPQESTAIRELDVRVAQELSR